MAGAVKSAASTKAIRASTSSSAKLRAARKASSRTGSAASPPLVRISVSLNSAIMSIRWRSSASIRVSA